MMPSELSVTILNVGHGNSAVVCDGPLTHIIDTGGEHVGLRLLDYLRSQGISRVNSLILSHGDEDHIGSATTLLLSKELTIDQVFLNSDSTKRTKAFQFLQVALRTARREKDTRVVTSLTLAQTADIKTSVLKLEILYPPPESTVSGPGGLGCEREAQTTNSLSAVIRLSGKSSMKVLLPADCGMEALSFWTEELVDPASMVIVFPHHGGRPGLDDVAAFAKAFVQATSPSFILFSIHESRFNLPRQEVLEAISAVCSHSQLICTQLPQRFEALCSAHPWVFHYDPSEVTKRLHLRIDLENGTLTKIQDLS